MAKENESRQNSRGKGKASPLAVILAPTRDLATQIFNDIKELGMFCTEPKINVSLAIGGVSKMMSEVMKAHILVGTMGSMIGLLKSNKLTLSNCKFFILDEAAEC